ncbi:MAG: family 10 glycosylhydrolase, partial [Clostridia bacterium]|nr:family 10 glycosylhydrolase [Clostridia bacterium]
MMEKLRQAGPVAALVLAILLAAQLGQLPETPSPSGDPPAVGDVFVGSDFRAVWIPYMSLDLSRTSNRHFGTFKAQFDALLAEVVRCGADTVIVHVRPFGDAMYRSTLFPWSHLLTGQQGQDPGYDPLAYMVEAAHKAGLKIHAWINPLRIRSTGTPSKLADSNVHSKWRSDNDPANDDWTVVTDTGIYLNPGRAEVRDYIIAGVEELV